MSTTGLTRGIKAEAARLGFDLCGVCPAATPAGIHHFFAWLDAGYAGEMAYLAARREAYADPRHVLPGAASLVMVAMNYRTQSMAAVPAGHGHVSCYAWGGDYHDLLRARLAELAAFTTGLSPSAECRGVVDTAPLLEREFAQLAGLGWLGKNTLLLNGRLGSWFFLGALLTNLELEYDEPFTADHCGSCRDCLDACPTGALVDAYRLDARRCISYLTIELRSPIPLSLRQDLGDWVFGCDICQDVCPWNRRPPVAQEEEYFAPSSGANPLELGPLFELSDAEFRRRFRRTPLWRAKRRGVLRNAAIVLGNQRSLAAIDPLRRAIDDPEPLVRGAAAWALGNYRSPSAAEALRQRVEVETDPLVREEILHALRSTESPS